MKQKIYFLGLGTLLLLCLGCVFKINHFPGAGIMLLISIITLILVFLPAALVNHYRAEGNRQNLLLYIVTWVTCFFIFSGMLFKIMHWPGAGIIMYIALPFPFVVFLPVFLVVTSKIEKFSIYNTVFVLFLLAAVSVFSALLAIGVSREKIDQSLAMALPYNNIENAIEGLSNTSGTGKQSALFQKADELLTIVNECQDKIYSEANITEEQWEKDPVMLSNPESGRTARKVLLGDKTSNLAGKFESALNGFVEELQKTPAYNNMGSQRDILFGAKSGKGIDQEWLNKNFEGNNLAWILVYLDAVEVNVNMIKLSAALEVK